MKLTDPNIKKTDHSPLGFNEIRYVVDKEQNIMGVMEWEEKGDKWGYSCIAGGVQKWWKDYAQALTWIRETHKKENSRQTQNNGVSAGGGLIGKAKEFFTGLVNNNN